MRLPLKRIFHEKRRVTIPLAAGLLLNVAVYAGVILPLSARVRGAETQARASLQQLQAAQREDNEARGMSPEEARRAARLKFGNTQKVRESLWMQNTPQRLAGIARDVKYAFRTLTRTPGFSIIAIVVMALCLGAATSLFTVVRSVLLRPLPL